MLNDGDFGVPAYQVMDRAMRAALQAPGKRPVDVYTENLDMLRFPEGALEAELAALFARKYESLPIDVVVAIGDGSADFAARHRERLWPGAYLLFQGVLGDLNRLTRLPRSSGWPTRHDIGGIAALARALRPSTQRLVVVSGTGNYDHRMARVAREQLAAPPKGMTVEYWEDVALDELLGRLARLGSGDAVVYVGISQDATGRKFHVADGAGTLAAASAAPVYGHLETMLGKGIVGGTMYSFESRGRRTAELIHQMLVSRPELPPVLEGGPSNCTVDARQLQRWGMSESRLPAGCEIRFPLPSLWREYRWHVVGALLVIAAQSVLIVALVLQRRGRTRAEGEAHRRREELAQAGRLALAGELTASIAHEINQPLGSILVNAGAAEALLKRDPGASSELRAIVADIRSADMRATEVIRRIRSLVTTRQAEREPVDADAMVREVLAVLRGEAARRDVLVETALQPGLPPLFVDRVQAQQALVNLCLNAMEAMGDRPPGERRLGVRTSPGPGESVVISVSDTGPGISPENLERLFDSFFTTKAQGTGLGLSITRSIAEAHGGGIAAENRAGGGAVFRLTLPTRAVVAQ